MAKPVEFRFSAHARGHGNQGLLAGGHNLSSFVHSCVESKLHPHRVHSLEFEISHDHDEPPLAALACKCDRVRFLSRQTKKLADAQVGSNGLRRIVARRGD